MEELFQQENVIGVYQTAPVSGMGEPWQAIHAQMKSTLNRFVPVSHNKDDFPIAAKYKGQQRQFHHPSINIKTLQNETKFRGVKQPLRLDEGRKDKIYSEMVEVRKVDILKQMDFKDEEEKGRVFEHKKVEQPDGKLIIHKKNAGKGNEIQIKILKERKGKKMEVGKQNVGAFLNLVGKEASKDFSKAINQCFPQLRPAFTPPWQTRTKKSKTQTDGKSSQIYQGNVHSQSKAVSNPFSKINIMIDRSHSLPQFLPKQQSEVKKEKPLPIHSNFLSRQKKEMMLGAAKKGFSRSSAKLKLFIVNNGRFRSRDRLKQQNQGRVDSQQKGQCLLKEKVYSNGLCQSLGSFEKQRLFFLRDPALKIVGLQNS